MFGWKILGWFVTFFTGGICRPWAVCMIYSWEAKHTVIDGHRLRFNGTAMQLFGTWLKWWVLTLVTCGIYGFWAELHLKQWITKHTTMEDTDAVLEEDTSHRHNEDSEMDGVPNVLFWAVVSIAVLLMVSGVYTLIHGSFSGEWMLLSGVGMLILLLPLGKAYSALRVAEARSGNTGYRVMRWALTCAVVVLAAVIIRVASPAVPDINLSRENEKNTVDQVSESVEIEPTEDVETTEPEETIQVSKEEENALRAAKIYLETMAFSREGLIKQLEYEQYSTTAATYAAEYCGADWDEQAEKAAKNYLDIMPFSRDELIEQLEYEGFTHEQAVYGVEANGY